VVNITETKTVRISVWDTFIAWIQTPLGFLIFLGVLIGIVAEIIVTIKYWDGIKRRIQESQLEANEKYAMYSKREWQKYLLLSGVLWIHIGGFIVSGILFVFVFPESEFFRITHITFAILCIPGVPLFGYKFGILYRSIKKRYKNYLSEKDFILEILAKEIVPCFSNPEIEAKFAEIGFENGQGKKIFKLLSGTIIEEHY